MWYRKNHKEVMRGQLSTDFLKDKEKGSKIQFFLLKYMLLNFLAKPDFIAYHYKYKNNISFQICTRCYKAPAFAWTIKSDKALQENRDAFNFFIFDSFSP